MQSLIECCHHGFFGGAVEGVRQRSRLVPIANTACRFCSLDANANRSGEGILVTSDQIESTSCAERTLDVQHLALRKMHVDTEIDRQCFGDHFLLHFAKEMQEELALSVSAPESDQRILLGKVLERDSEFRHLAGIDWANGAFQRRRRKDDRADAVRNVSNAY